ncbi:glycosyltransferase family 1 protein [Flavonifractor hominis]|uniref:Glycosyltransferase family 1 protein n=1 Tax=Flavonifractor hominis TaxID=3133178 RepID=A0ABV1EMK1_9FIRM
MYAQKPIRVLHVIGRMDRGGAETMLMNLYRHMDRTKVQFDFVEHSAKEAAFDGEIRALGGRIERCPGYGLRDLARYAAWWDDFFTRHKGEYRAIHGHMGSTAAVYLSKAKRYGIYTIAHSHNTNRMHTIKDITYAAVSYPVRYIAQFFFGCSTMAGYSRYGRRIASDSKRFRVLPNAIDLSRFAFSPEEREQVRRELHLKDEFLLGHVGRFEEQKNHRFLLDIFECIHRAEPDSKLLLVGDGPLRPQIEQEIAERGLGHAVCLTGVVADVWRYYQAMDVLLFPSLYEGLPVTLVEAQAAGLPCVISNHITPEILLTDSICTQPLEHGPEAWAQRALELRGGAVRRSDLSRLREAGYDINQTAQWLQAFYLGIH